MAEEEMFEYDLELHLQSTLVLLMGPAQTLQLPVSAKFTIYSSSINGLNESRYEKIEYKFTIYSSSINGIAIEDGVIADI